MKRFVLLMFVLMLGCFCQETFSKGVKIVVIDAGHGGKDSGTRARSRKHKHEKYIALDIAKKLGKHIEKNCPDVKVIYTRTKDVYLTLNQRAKVANKANADLFISIHVDAVETPKVHGASVYVLGLHRSEDNLKVAMRENAVMLQEDNYATKYAGFKPNDAESYIIFSLMQNQYLSNSMLMADFVNKHLKSRTRRFTKGVKQAGFYVLREVSMPSVLIETGYITNTSDANFLCSKSGQDKTAMAVFNAFKDYKNFMEKHTSDLKDKPLQEQEKAAKKVQEVSGDTYFSVQLLYSGKNLPENSKHFKGLSPVFSNENRYFYGKTKSYNEALGLQREARKLIPDAYLVGFHNGRRIKASQLRDILNGK